MYIFSFCKSLLYLQFFTEYISLILHMLVIESSYIFLRKKVDGWDDPRMSTICGIRRRGYTPEAIRNFARDIGVSKSNSIVDISMLENAIREDLKLKAQRKMAVLHPLKLVITNYPEDKVEYLEDY